MSVVAYQEHQRSQAVLVLLGAGLRQPCLPDRALAVTALLTHVARVSAWWLLPLAAFAALGWSLHRATAGKS